LNGDAFYDVEWPIADEDLLALMSSLAAGDPRRLDAWQT